MSLYKQSTTLYDNLQDYINLIDPKTKKVLPRGSTLLEGGNSAKPLKCQLFSVGGMASKIRKVHIWRILEIKI